MQKLTEVDIRRYVEDKLVGSPLTESLSYSPSSKPDDMVEEVVRKAEGVFLWVTLSVGSLLCGIRNGNSWEDLQRRLKDVPSVIFELYAHIWARTEVDHPIYAKEAALYFRLAHLVRAKRLADMAILVDNGLHVEFFNPVSN